MQTTGFARVQKKRRAAARLELLAEDFPYWMTPSITFGTELTLTSKTLPSISGLRDPSAVGNDSYLGSKPNVSAVPKVIDGVIQ